MSLGHPFSIYSKTEDPYAFYFPVLCDGEVVLVYTVGYDFYNIERTGQICYTGSMSENWAGELNSFCKKATPDDPILFYREKNNHTMVKLGDEIVFLAHCPGVLEEADMSSPEAPCKSLLPVPVTKAIYTINTPTDYECSDVIHSPAEINSSLKEFDTIGENVGIDNRGSVTLSLTIIETQGNNNWCAAYAGATIVRFRQGSVSAPTASDFMHQIYVSPTIYDSLSVAHVIQAAANYGFTNLYYPSSPINLSTVQNQINYAKPF